MLFRWDPRHVSIYFYIYFSLYLSCSLCFCFSLHQLSWYFITNHLIHNIKLSPLFLFLYVAIDSCSNTVEQRMSELPILKPAHLTSLLLVGSRTLFLCFLFSLWQENWDGFSLLCWMSFSDWKLVVVWCSFFQHLMQIVVYLYVLFLLNET